MSVFSSTERAQRELSPHTVSDSDLKRRRVGNATPKVGASFFCFFLLIFSSLVQAHRRVTSPIVVGQDHAHTDRRSETSASPKRTSLKPASPIGEMVAFFARTDWFS